MYFKSTTFRLKIFQPSLHYYCMHIPFTARRDICWFITPGTTDMTLKCLYIPHAGFLFKMFWPINNPWPCRVMPIFKSYTTVPLLLTLVITGFIFFYCIVFPYCHYFIWWYGTSFCLEQCFSKDFFCGSKEKQHMC